jgi:hypothetical protein
LVGKVSPIAPPMPCMRPFSATQATAPQARGSGAIARQVSPSRRSIGCGLAVLLDEAADGVELAVEHGDADMVGAERHLRASTQASFLGS